MGVLTHLGDYKIFLLTDYELLKQPHNGLNVIEETAVQRAILVTSYYTKKDIRDRSLNLGAKILPKQLASEVPILLNEKSDESGDAKIADAIILDDDQMFTNAFVAFAATSDKVIAAYNDPDQFLEECSSYDKDTKILLDRDLSRKITGLDIAKKLHEMGYQQLYLVSGNNSCDLSNIPDYLQTVCKTDIMQLEI